jgi:hypothetical protein
MFRKVWNKMKREPLIPIGVLLTTACLVGAGRAMRANNQERVQTFFRLRVAAQGLTVMAIVAGGYYLQDERQKEREIWKLAQKIKEEEQRQKWIKELEARDAEDKAMMAQRKKKAEAAAKKESIVQQAEAAVEAKERGEKVGTDGKGVLSALGKWVGADASRDAPKKELKVEATHSKETTQSK